MKKNVKSIQNFFKNYEIWMYVSVPVLLYGIVDWWYGFTSIWYVTGTLCIVAGLTGIILFDCLRIKTDEFDRYLRGRIDCAKGAGLFEAEDTFLAYVVENAGKIRVGGDGKVRSDVCYETALKVDRSTLRIESYCVHLLTEETDCFAADFPMPGVKAKQETVDYNDGKRTWRQCYLTLTAVDGRGYRFPVPYNSSDVDQFVDRLNRYNQAR